MFHAATSDARQVGLLPTPAPFRCRRNTPQANEPLSGSHTGKEQVVRALTELTRRTHRELVKIVATLAGPERGAIIARESFGTGTARVEMDRVLVFTIAADRLRECWVYDADPDLLDRYVNGSP